MLLTGGQDPFTRLKRALKAEIDEDAWGHRSTGPTDAPVEDVDE